MDRKDSRLYYVKHFDDVVQEGGAARNFAFYTYLMNKFGGNMVTYNIVKGSFIIKLLNRLRALLSIASNGSGIAFFHIGSIIYLFLPLFKLFGSWSGMVRYFKWVSRNKTLYVEVNDLYYEQALDLEMPVSDGMKSFQESLFSLKGVNFVFASREMCRFAIERYLIDPEQCQTVLNGSDELANLELDSELEDVLTKMDSSLLKYVYVGTLGKGRQIEEMIDQFTSSKHYLILIGLGGDWLMTLPDNIIHLGAFNEKEALKICSLCDVGLIPYDPLRLYYNICFPTKVAFYISAGLPILCTPIKETQDHLQEYDLAKFAILTEWSAIIQNSTFDSWQGERHAVSLHKSQFYWQNLLSKINWN